MNPQIGDIKSVFASQKRLAEKAMEQLSDDQLHEPLHPETNSIAVIVKHVAGNMRSRWTGFLTSDGEKPWRDRDSEFVDTFASRDEILNVWETGWQTVYATLDTMTDDDLSRPVFVRGEEHTALRAILRQLDHYGYHIGQIVLIARVLAGEKWKVLSIPRGESKQYNERVWKKA
jgi:uncharacterized damage-inducible protein DinB